ncbi:hypothetical protein [Microbispora sp. CA-102843]|uniref:hypothetical protein n=1 Tax=Microbispora sp. CA-102843 TaxID=3239952 RepID=UPI003D922DDA
MRYKVVVTRVQVAERFVRAISEEEAAAKVRDEFDRPYGYFGSWKTTASEIDVAEQTTVIRPTHLSAEGPGSRAAALGIDCGGLHCRTLSIRGAGYARDDLPSSRLHFKLRPRSGPVRTG